MIKGVLQNAFDDTFERLGVEVLFQQSPAISFYVMALIKEPENVYEVGLSRVVGQVAEFSVKASDASPKVGDLIFLGSKKYKIHEEPLLDASNYIVKFQAVLLER
jgi:hypothetical protein